MENIPIISKGMQIISHHHVFNEFWILWNNDGFHRSINCLFDRFMLATSKIWNNLRFNSELHTFYAMNSCEWVPSILSKTYSSQSISFILFPIGYMQNMRLNEYPAISCNGMIFYLWKLITFGSRIMLKAKKKKRKHKHTHFYVVEMYQSFNEKLIIFTCNANNSF